MLKLRHRFRGIHEYQQFFADARAAQPSAKGKFEIPTSKVECAAGQKIDEKTLERARKKNAMQFSLAGSQAVRRPLAKRPGYHKTWAV